MFFNVHTRSNRISHPCLHTHTCTRVTLRKNSARVQLERRRKELKRKFCCASCPHASRESDYRCLEAHVDGRKSIERRPESLDTARPLGQTDLRATCQRVQDRKPLYSDILRRLCPSTSRVHASEINSVVTARTIPAGGAAVSAIFMHRD